MNFHKYIITFFMLIMLIIFNVHSISINLRLIQLLAFSTFTCIIEITLYANYNN